MHSKRGCEAVRLRHLLPLPCQHVLTRRGWSGWCATCTASVLGVQQEEGMVVPGVSGLGRIVNSCSELPLEHALVWWLPQAADV